MRVVLLGRPGAGKGTQGVRLASEFGAQHLATGDMLRAEVAAGTELGRLAKTFMDRGELVTDEVIIGMINSRLVNATGMVLDGFPRTLRQAAALDQALENAGAPLDRVIYFDVDRAELVKRLLNRAVEEGRSDDTPETIERRMDVYDEQTAPVLNYYRTAGKALDIDGMGTPDEVYARLVVAARGT